MNGQTFIEQPFSSVVALERAEYQVSRQGTEPVGEPEGRSRVPTELVGETTRTQ